ncbi:prion-inhibition and propagation domain-containing protein [Pochonia chlamydosporia 170]|uniref:Prion-inhibition and propagation domain-containing protein n=1 Tax=Pochonia chlamydosporia 170 TaxID=1380566 RepID=A0A179F5K1_METCM|nr:prion-inhibition and propagation domain-containing protein [Pochonia chlamydosporia 170]OAQ60705.1 prion-inhibition and propagation domain-containing protein [Pochonia chlamydosporia 170]
MEIAASALQFTTMAVQAFRGCVVAIELIRTAQHMGIDGDIINTALVFEEWRLLSWAQRAGLHDNTPRQTINWPLASVILQQLVTLLSSAEVLQRRYSLRVTAEDTEAAEETQAVEAKTRGVAKLLARLKPEFSTVAGKIIQENNSTFKRLRWAVLDKNKLKQFQTDISELISKLEFLPDSAVQEEERRLFNRLVREAISLSTTTAEAGQIKQMLDDAPQTRKVDKSINAVAYLKQVRLVLGADKRSDEVTPNLLNHVGDTAMPKMPKLPILQRSLEPWSGGELYVNSLGFGTYHNKQVLVQWKPVGATQWDKYTKQIKRLAVFLMSLSDESFLSLKCLGYLPLEAQGRHGIVYSLPEGDTDWDFRSLKQLIQSQPHVSLKRRLELAQALANTLLQLHTAGWLHKNLRSDNIIFLAPRGSDDTVFLNSEPYVVGYEYARSDTDDSAKAFTQLPDTEVEADLYRHPQARGSNRETFQKRFDMYSLGCIALELVTWQPLVDVFSLYTKHDLKAVIGLAQASNEAIALPSLTDLFESEDAIDIVTHQAGESVLEVIRTCFSAEKAKEGEEGLLTDQTAVVEKLRWCRV